MRLGGISSDAIAVTQGPGLVGALLVGVAEAKALAYALHKPLIGVHHIEGHIAANYISDPNWEPPFLCLVVSGGQYAPGNYRGLRRKPDPGAYQGRRGR